MGADHNIPVRVGTGVVSATIVDLEVWNCDELRLRTKASLYTWISARVRNRRPMESRCERAEGQSTKRLVVEYRESNGSTVKVTLDDGSVSVLPPKRHSRVERSSVDGVRIVDVWLNYD